MKRKGESTQKAKQEKRPDATPSEIKPSKGTGMAAYMKVSAPLLMLVLISGMSLVGWLQFAHQQAIADQRMALQLAEQHVMLIEESVGYAKKLVAQVAESELVASVAAGDVSQEDRARQLSMLLPNVTVTLVGSKQILLPESLSFSAREVVQRTRESLEAEVAIIPGTPLTMHVAQSTANNGAALLSWKMERLQTLLAKLGATGAHVVVRMGGTELASAGRPATGEIVQASAGTDIVVSVTLPKGASDPALLVLFISIMTGAVLLGLLVLVFTLRAIDRGLKKDSALLIHLAQDLASNTSARTREPFTFSVLERATKSLRKLAARATGSRNNIGATGAGSMDSRLHDDDYDLLVGEDRKGAGVRDRQLPAEIFRAYDIRGVVGQNLTAEYVELIGRAVGTEARLVGQDTAIVAHDGRLSGEELNNAFVAGLSASGCNVIDIGMVPTPVLYYATKVLDSQTGICITGSHNPPNENGLKIVINDETLHGDRITGLRERIARNEFSSGQGTVKKQDISAQYVSEIVGDIVLARPMKVVIDCANGVTGKLAPDILRQLGCEVVELFTEIDGSFPNHSPDTSNPDNYVALHQAIQTHQAEVGIAFDGDGDRLGVVTSKGEIIWADRLMMLFARDLLTRSPGADIIFDVKCSRALSLIISHDGGRPLMWKTGHSLIKAKLKETGAPLAGEMSGHIFFADRWHGFDDGIYSACRLLEILSMESSDATAVFDSLTTGISTPELSIKVADEIKFDLIDKLVQKAGSFTGGAPTKIDGLRIDYADGWGLIRASNTGPKLVARFEGRDDAALARIQSEFRQQLLALNQQLTLPF